MIDIIIEITMQTMIAMSGFAVAVIVVRMLFQWIADLLFTR